MRLSYVSLVLLVNLVGSYGELPPPEANYKILILLPQGAPSFMQLFTSLAKALADRGHKVVMLTNSTKPMEHPNIREISHGLQFQPSGNRSVFDGRKLLSAANSGFAKLLPFYARELYNTPKVRELYDKRKEFDLIIICYPFNEMMYPFAHEMPFITVAMPGVDFKQSGALGNLINPAYIHAFVTPFSLDTVFGRLLNVFSHIYKALYWRHWAVVPRIQEEIDKHFPDLPPLLEIERNMSLTLMNSHFSMDMTVPLLPSQIEIGAIQCRPARPLPEDLKSWIEGAGEAGVIYFSLGSVARGNTVPVEFRNMFIEAFKRLEQRVLWKFESDLDVPKNVKISGWLPQQDILGHPNVKVFISHGGLLSTQESTYHGTPLLMMPIYGDQPKNAEITVSNGLGLSLVWEQLSVDLIANTLQELVNNPKYSQNAAKVSRRLRDQPMSPRDRAIYWTEYVIRHQGAPHLKCKGEKLSWVQYLLLDALALFILMIVVAVLLLRWTFRKLGRAVSGSAGKTKTKAE